jgi:hypothetical protein
MLLHPDEQQVMHHRCCSVCIPQALQAAAVQRQNLPKSQALAAAMQVDDHYQSYPAGIGALTVAAANDLTAAPASSIRLKCVCIF